MATQYSVTVRNAQLDALETAIGVSPKLRFYTGAVPANCAAANSGTQLAELQLPVDFMSAASGGVKDLLGTWEDTSADATGVIAHYRIFDNAGTTCHIQGTVTITAGGGDMEVDNTNIAVGQNITVTAYSITRGNA